MNKRVAGWIITGVVLAYLSAWSITGDAMLALRTVGYVSGFGGALGSIGLAINEWEQ